MPAEPATTATTTVLLSALRGDDLMDLGTEAQAQGRALSIRAVMNRLAAVSIDLQTLGLPVAADIAIDLREGLAAHVDELTAALEARGRERRGDGS